MYLKYSAEVAVVVLVVYAIARVLGLGVASDVSGTQ
jgi:hypothetical protein